MIAVFLALLITTAAGAPAATRHGRWSASLSFLYGSGVVFVSMMLLALLDLRWTRVSVIVAMTIIAGLTLLIPRRPVLLALESTKRSLAIDAMTLAWIIAFALFATEGAPWHWDFWAIWGLKGHVVFEHGGIDVHFLRSEWNQFAHPGYPLLLPSNLAFPAVLAGRWDDRWLGLLFAGFVAAGAGVARRLAAREASPAAAAAIGLAAAALVASPYVGLAEGPLLAFGTAGVAFVRVAVKGEDAAWLPASILLGLAGSTKNEGLTLLLAVFVATLIAGRWRSAWRLWPAAAIALPWLVAARVMDLPRGFSSGSPFSRLLASVDSWGEIAGQLLRATANPICWAFVIAGAVFTLRRERFVLLVVAMQFATFLIAYLVTPWGAEWHITNSWDRLSQQLLAPAAYAVLIALAAQLAGRTNEHDQARSDLL